MALDEQRLLARIRRIEDYLARVGRHIDVPFEVDSPHDVPPEVLEYVRADNRLMAVKTLAELRGLGLREAKAIVDEL
jgi:hypothetical protein